MDLEFERKAWNAWYHEHYMDKRGVKYIGFIEWLKDRGAKESCIEVFES